MFRYAKAGFNFAPTFRSIQGDCSIHSKEFRNDMEHFKLLIIHYSSISVNWEKARERDRR